MRRLLILAALALTGLVAGNALAATANDTITTFAGNGTAGFSGDGGAATAAQLNVPFGIAEGADGSLYIADILNSRIRRVSPQGTITTVAGTGTAGFSGDGGAATAAQLKSPYAVAVGPDGSLYIADAGNSRVRRVNAQGTITTLAGTGTPGFSGDNGPASAAQLNVPVGVAVDGAGNVYIADLGNNRIRRVNAQGTITTVAGTGTAGFSGDNGPATAAQIKSAYGVAVDGAGNLYIADTLNNRVRRVNAQGTIATVAGTGAAGFSGNGGPATGAQLNTPVGVALDAGGNLYIADYGNERVRRVDAGGTIATLAGTGTAGSAGDGGPAGGAQLAVPAGVAADGAGDVFISESAGNRVRRVDNARPTASFTATPASGAAPLGVAFDGSASADSDGQIASYAWDFGDGAKGTGKTASHGYDKAGTFTATLTVTDDSGATGQATKSITVDAAPSPSPGPQPGPRPTPSPKPHGHGHHHKHKHHRHHHKHKHKHKHKHHRHHRPGRRT